jgi:hypothetical protein
LTTVRERKYKYIINTCLSSMLLSVYVSKLSMSGNIFRLHEEAVLWPSSTRSVSAWASQISPGSEPLRQLEAAAKVAREGIRKGSDGMGPKKLIKIT